MDNKITVDVSVRGIDKATDKARELNEAIEKAKTAAAELASLMQGLSLEVDMPDNTEEGDVQERLARLEKQFAERVENTDKWCYFHHNILGDVRDQCKTLSRVVWAMFGTMCVAGVYILVRLLL